MRSDAHKFLSMHSFPWQEKHSVWVLREPQQAAAKSQRPRPV